MWCLSITEQVLFLFSWLKLLIWPCDHNTFLRTCLSWEGKVHNQLPFILSRLFIEARGWPTLRQLSKALLRLQIPFHFKCFENPCILTTSPLRYEQKAVERLTERIHSPISLIFSRCHCHGLQLKTYLLVNIYDWEMDIIGIEFT